MSTVDHANLHTPLPESSAPAPETPHSLSSTLADPPTAILGPEQDWQLVDLHDLWHYRELLGFLALRDIKVRYKQTALGILWALIQPIATMLVFTVFFGHLGKLDATTSTPYAILVLAALLPWQLFAGAIDNVGNSLVANQNLITKVYFPRIIIPLAGILSGLVDFAIAFGVLILMMAYYHMHPRLALLTVPLFVALAIITALAVGLWLSALNVQYRDVRYALPFLVQFWLFITPVAYPITIVPVAWRGWYALNPMVGVVEGFRWSLLGTADAPGLPLLVSSSVTLFLLLGGLIYFRRMEASFADVV